MVSLLVVEILKYIFGVPVVAMFSDIYVGSRNPVNYIIDVVEYDYNLY